LPVSAFVLIGTIAPERGVDFAFRAVPVRSGAVLEGWALGFSNMADAFRLVCIDSNGHLFDNEHMTLAVLRLFCRLAPVYSRGPILTKSYVELMREVRTDRAQARRARRLAQDMAVDPQVRAGLTDYADELERRADTVELAAGKLDIGRVGE
jgi:hypothetical protein